MGDDGAVSVPNVLADRYASPEMAELWSPEHKIVLERRLWVAVMKAQRDLGIDVPAGAIDAYESVLEVVDLDSIAERERVSAELGQDGRLLIRPSGTEPLLRVMVEARDVAVAHACAERLAEAAVRG